MEIFSVVFMNTGISRLILVSFLISTLFFSSINASVLANSTNDIPTLYETAYHHLENGELHEAIGVYDEILDISPGHTDSMLMKGIALSNLERHKQSMKELYKVLENEPRNISAMVGLGVGFGNYGEYKIAQEYFDRAHSISPENHVITNYKNFADKTVKKYPYNEVKKPEIFVMNSVDGVPSWVKNTAGWWADDQIDDQEFIKAIQFLIKNGISKLIL